MPQQSPRKRPKTFGDLGVLQREVMAVVWDCGEATVQQVRAAMRRRLAYTTVLSAMQKLEKAGWLRHRSRGRAYAYRPARSWDTESRLSLRRLLTLVFRGDRRLLLQRLLDDQELSDDELAELGALIRRKRKACSRG